MKRISMRRNSVRRNSMRRGLIFLSWLSFASLQATAVELTKDFNFHGNLINDSTGTPIATSTSMVFEIFDPTGSCLLYQESQTVTPDSEGFFSVKVGGGTRASAGIDGGAPWKNIFQNNSSVSPRAQCSSGYTPAAYDGRQLRVTVNGVVLSPDFAMSSVPMATVAESLQGKQPVDFVPSSGNAMVNGSLQLLNQSPLKFQDAAGTHSVNFQAPVSLAATTSFTWPGNAGTALQVLTTDGSGMLSWTTPTGSGTFTNQPQWNGAPSGANDLVNKSYVDAQVASGLPDVGTVGTYTKVTTDAKGRVVSGVGLAESDIPTLTSVGKVVGSAIDTGTIGGTTAVNTSGNITTTGTVQGGVVGATNLRVFNGANFVQLTAPALGANLNFLLPAADGANGALLKTNGAGQLSFAGLSATDIPNLDSSKVTSGILPVSRGGTGLSGYGINSVLVSNGTGTAVNSLNCTSGQTIKFDASGFAGCSPSQWTTSGSDIFYNAGNIGVGTSAPISIFHVSSSSMTNAIVSAGTGANAELLLTGPSASFYPGVNLSYQGSSGNFLMGRVASGSSNLSYPWLDFNGDSGSFKVISNSASVGAKLSLTRLNNVSANVNNNVLGAVNFEGFNGATNTSAGAGLSAMATENWSPAANGTALILKSTGNGSSVSTERMRIDQNGRIGIGITSPPELFTLYSNTVSGPALTISNSATNGTNQQSVINLETLNNASGTLGYGVAGVKGWQIYANSNAYAGAPNNLGITFYDGTSWHNALEFSSGGANESNTQFTGQFVGAAFTQGSTTIDFNTGNTQTTTASCSAMTLNNLKPGGTYHLIVTGGTSATCTLSGSGLTFKYKPANAPVTASLHAVYHIFVGSGGIAYVDWNSGYN